MRLLDEVVEHRPGVSTRARRATRLDDWFFRGHFPGEPVVPAVVLIEMIAQTAGLAASPDDARGMRVAAVGNFRFPESVTAGAMLEISAQVVGRLGALIKVKGVVAVDGRPVASGSLTLAEL